MFDDVTLGPRILANPAIGQGMVIKELESRSNGVYTIADPNNAFNFLLEASSSMVAQLIRSDEAAWNTFYANRSTTAADLYPKLSDFDYTAITSTPAKASFVLTLDANYLIRNAVSYNAYYNRIVIPATTVINMGLLSFGLYYPIQFLINKNTNQINVTYDLTTPNPLYTPETNLLDSVYQYTANGLSLISITFDMYQFTQTAYLTTTNPQSGFNNSYSYTDNFYAVRVFSTLNGVTTELSQVFMSQNYDPLTPTARILVSMDTNTLQVQIPQVYFNTGLVGNTIKAVIYTTKGVLNQTIAAADASTITTNFDTTSTPFAAPLAQPPYITMVPASAVIAGGSNGITFEQLRAQVINGSNSLKTPILPSDIEAAGQRAGFNTTKYLDNLTDRIYFASNQLATESGTTVPVVVANIQLTNNTMTGVSTILDYASDQIAMILPTTIFSYNNDTNTCIPLQDAQVRYLAGLSAPQLAAEMNTNQYTRQPYHIALYTAPKYPLAKTFNLMDPVMSNLVFVKDNVSSAAQLVVTGVQMTHLGDGTGGYQILLSVQKSAPLANTPESDIAIILAIQDRSNVWVYLQAQYQASTTGYDIYRAHLPTDYHITEDGYIRTMMTTVNGIQTLCEIPLASTFTVLTAVSPAQVPDATIDPGMNANMPVVYSNWPVTVQQSMKLTFGTDLSGSIFNIVNATWGPQTYATYPEDQYVTYATDVYATDANNVPIVSVQNGQPTLQKLHSAGDFVLDASGNKIIQYPKGSVIMQNGTPVVLSGRSVEYYMSAMMLDGRMYASQNVADTTYLSGFTKQISSYITTVAALANTLAEQTEMYYQPANTMGTGIFTTGNNKSVTMPLTLSFTVTYYVPASVYQDVQQQAVMKSTTIATITQAVNSETINTVDIGATLKSTFGSDIAPTVEVGGINNDPTLQTLMITGTNAFASVARKLNLKTDGTLSFDADVNVVFIDISKT